MIRFKRMFVLLFWAAVLVLPAADALAILKDLGPTDPADGYPVWYRDFSTNVSANGQDFPQGLPLELCDSLTENANGYLCNLLPEDPDGAIGAPGYDPAQPRDLETNFPHESFYFMADSAIAGGGDFSDAALIIGLEAAFGADVADGNQITFARVRVRIDVNTPGTYRVTHPYGVLIFPDVPAGIRTINYTEDIGIGNPGDFTGALAGKVGPFLTWDTDFPIVAGDEVFIGDPAIPHTVTGSPFGTNFFRVERIDALGNTITSDESNLFNLVGKIYTTPIPTPLEVTRASYVRDASDANIFIFAEADIISNNFPVLSVLEVSGPGIEPTTMDTDGNGNFFAHLVTAAEALPGVLTVTNLSDLQLTSVEATVTDEVTVTSANYDTGTSTLSLTAVSSDIFSPPTLTSSFGNLVDGSLTINNLLTPPPFVTVSSSANGSQTKRVTVDNIKPLEPIVVVLNNNPASPQSAGTQVTFTADATGGSGIYEYRFWLKPEAGTWSVVQGYSSDNTWIWDTTGLAEDRYFVQVDVRNAGSLAARETSAVKSFNIGPGPATGAALTADLASPQPAGTSVTFTAAGSGGSGTYEYRFWLKSSGGVWSVVQGYSANNTWTWDTAGLTADTYYIQVDIRNAGSLAKREVADVISYLVQ